ncbi:hypothetical protein [Leptospira interrogans]|uniref:Uncharacterized protein n=2 Tax=Leptospira interrogans TaxID=173 RepID=A0A0E2D591_LEPIR|nr:hypothetical protein [Leptospira interrogans]EMN28086.1 hypothetical protein LEP1GSC083_0122 [Leptospira interrogans serovar Pyrogenes str. L0374]EKR55204.1 hypothetical protein LEP1GSC105_0049 [Leptospira interrogans str. UI 12758]EMN34219.1 hypothetical protein LEP1GSC084_1651 [Leptospira interrogans serovar Medanensis str. L0448]EMN95915.1 hypothetical protein LEP1GSC110_0798 [Leptospira interrogans serovar Medanensis str. UT053]UNE65299.1 hypothetical protein FH588_02030 [Leptospira int
MNKLLDKLPQFNPTDPTFQSLWGNLDRPELSPVTNINDINKGALFNSVEWHLSFQELAFTCATLTQAEGRFLTKWANLLGIERPLGMDDAEFVGYILGYVLSNEPTLTKISLIFQRPDYAVLRCNELGFTSDVSATDTGLFLPGPNTKAVSSIVTPLLGVSYILVEDFSSISNVQITELNRILAAGTAVYIGAKNAD